MTDALEATTVLVVDDDEVFRERLARALRERGYDVRTAEGHVPALATARKDPPEMAIIDLRMPGPSGLEVLRDLLDIEPATRCVMLTGYGSISNAVDAVKLGAVDYVQKPASVAQILAAFERAEKPALEPTHDYEAPSLARVEWEHIQRVLSDTGGNISEASRRLGIHRRSLQRKLYKYAPK